jgi:hypothetical protein
VQDRIVNALISMAKSELGKAELEHKLREDGYHGHYREVVEAIEEQIRVLEELAGS